MHGVTYDLQGAIRTWIGHFRTPGASYRYVELASLDDALALTFQSMGASGLQRGDFDVGAFETANLLLLEVDRQGRRRRSELFADERLGDAIARLYQRHAELLPEGPERERAVATARSVRALVGPKFMTVETASTVLARDIEGVDHRRVVGLGSAKGAEQVLNVVRSMWAITGDLTLRVDDVPRLRPDALLIDQTSIGTDRVGGGRFERRLLNLWIFDADGRVIRFEQFDPEQEHEAVARFDALTAERPTARFENAATRMVARIVDVWRARNWEGFAASAAPEVRFHDRRRMVRLELDRAHLLETYRFLFDLGPGEVRFEALATGAIAWRFFAGTPTGPRPASTSAPPGLTRLGLPK